MDNVLRKTIRTEVKAVLNETRNNQGSSSTDDSNHPVGDVLTCVYGICNMKRWWQFCSDILFVYIIDAYFCFLNFLHF